MDDKQKAAIALALNTLAMLVNGNFPKLAEELKEGAKEFTVEVPKEPETETPKA
ncbi:hypothetical protein [Pelosinus sp. IPA-1]|uniref:hypothetical protein n=1 Tax=Pelosinus sp. IPA-1 TaxID=3029569 RepID=UPI0024362287|nr:hypothetical protein [Pelosinus sp. IPA-1]GMB00919.1 hypothetical protein PIPA1_37180 [Pelosinus sp. IPA-1]